LLPGSTVQPFIKITDTNTGINFILDFIIDYLSLWQSNDHVRSKLRLHLYAFTLPLIGMEFNWHLS